MQRFLYLQDRSEWVEQTRAALAAEALSGELIWVNSPEAFQSALHSELGYDLIIIDYAHPGLPGPEALRRAQQWLPGSPVLFVCYRREGSPGGEAPSDAPQAWQNSCTPGGDRAESGHPVSLDEAGVLACLRAGAVDFLLDPSPGRLGQGLRRALREAQLVTKLGVAQANATRAASLLQATLEATPEGLLMVDLAGKVATYNRRFMLLCGLPEQVLAPMHLDRVLQFLVDQFGDPDAFLAETRLLGAQAGREGLGRLTGKGGQVLEGQERPHRLDGQTRGRVFSFRDVTQREQNTAKLKRTEASHQRLRQEQLGALAAGAARAFRPGIDKLNNRLQLLEASRPLSEAQRRHLHAAGMAVAGLDSMLRQLLEPALAPAAPVPPLELNALLERLRARAEAILPQGMALQVQAGLGLPAVAMDPAHLEQVLMALLGNARDALQGSGVITLRTGVLAAAEAGGPGLFIEVLDEGPGLTPQVRECMFDPFFSTQANAPGLGLWLARRTVEQYGGGLRAEPRASRGTRLRIELPGS